VTVTITDSTGTAQPALLYGVYASSNQINFMIPDGTAAGPALVTITLPGEGTIATVVNIVSVAPGIFTDSSNGQGVYSGQVVYVAASGSQTVTSSANPISLTGGNQV
jgi:uncharacterized protein (TIGR03437 family)